MRSKATLAGQLLDVFNKAGEDHNFIEPEETYKLITPKTLLIVTDTYQKRLLEDQKIYEKCSRVVVIDHHRMAVGHIDNPILLYHEPFASSASELVCELLQFMPAQNNITQLEAQALLSGIMLDTRSFALHVGVRTFEAAAWPKPPRPSACSIFPKKNTKPAPLLWRALTSTKAALSPLRMSLTPP